MKSIRPLSLENAPMQFAPENELGVVFLFSFLAKKLQFRVVEIKPQYPDCIAYRRSGSKEDLVRIEFEYKSSNFISHKHDIKGCDAIVCWEHDSPDIAEEIEVIELKKFFGVSFKVWIQPAIKTQWTFLDNYGDCINWAVSKKATPGDLLLMYRCFPMKAITDIFILDDQPKERGDADWRDGEAVFGQMKRLCRMESPVFLDDFQKNRILKTSNFVRKNMQGNLHITSYWPYLYDLIIERNPDLSKKLSKYAPEYV